MTRRKKDEAEMSFLEHLEELRWRIIYSLIGIVVGTIVAWIFIDYLVNGILLLPAREAKIHVQNLKPFGQLFLYLEVALIFGMVFSIPNIFYQMWKFLAPALKKNEKRYLTAIVGFTTLCFAIGIVFGYFVMVPITFKFAAKFGTEAIENNFAINEYFSIVISIILGSAVVFELPMLSFFLSKLGISTPRLMSKYRRHSIVAIMILAAALTPGTDPVAQILLAIPLVLLYEISILVSKFSQKKVGKEKEN